MKSISNKRFQFSLLLLLIIYMVGIVSILAGHADRLMLLTPCNLLFASALLLYNAEGINKTYLSWFAVIALTGYLAEVIGVKTGIVFGEYSYGATLGYKFFDVPLIIGVNWAVLVFATAAIMQRFHIPNWAKAMIAASIMVMYDILLEPVAIRFDFWTWAEVSVPFQNYLAWWFIAFVMLFGTFRFVKNLNNKLAIPIILVQTVFFLVLFIHQNLSIH